MRTAVEYEQVEAAMSEKIDSCEMGSEIRGELAVDPRVLHAFAITDRAVPWYVDYYRLR